MITITMLYNNIPQDPTLATGWGLSCLIEGMEKTILFDTGGDGQILLSNMMALEKEPTSVDAVVLSHMHGDHTGGLSDFLKTAGDVELYVLESFPNTFKRGAEEAGFQVTAVNGSVDIASGIFSTGQMGEEIKEQALVLKANAGLVVILGCAHPGMVNMIGRAKQVSSDNVYLALGGFHIMGYSGQEINAVEKALKDLGVKKIAPSHCTGKRAVEMFRQGWRNDFVAFGCGGRLSFE